MSSKINRIKIGIIGYKGRMGRSILNAILNTEMAEVSGAISHDQSGEDIGDIIGKTIGVKSSESIIEVFQNSHVVIEFTNPATMEVCLRLSERLGVPLVSGTTGHDHGELMSEVARKVPILWSANTSIGINILSNLVKEVARKLDEEYDIEVLEVHHAHKKDTPSGTALTLGKSAASGRQVELDSVVRGNVRKKGQIGFAAIRGGGVFGEHKVMFMNEDEYIELGHVSLNRDVYARGAVKAALWLSNQQKNKIYSMQDVLNGKL